MYRNQHPIVRRNQPGIIQLLTMLQHQIQQTAPDNVIVQRSIEQAIVSLCGYRLNYLTSNEVGVLWIAIPTTSASRMWTTVAARGTVGSWSFAEISNNPRLLIQAIQQLPTPAGYINLTMSFDGDKPISTTLVEL